MTLKIPPWVKETEKCTACHHLGMFESCDLSRDDREVHVWYMCKCGERFGFAYQGKFVIAYKEFLDGLAVKEEVPS